MKPRLLTLPFVPLVALALVACLDRSDEGVSIDGRDANSGIDANAGSDARDAGDAGNSSNDAAPAASYSICSQADYDKFTECLAAGSPINCWSKPDAETCWKCGYMGLHFTDWGPGTTVYDEFLAEACAPRALTPHCAGGDSAASLAQCFVDKCSSAFEKGPCFKSRCPHATVALSCASCAFVTAYSGLDPALCEQ